MRAHALAPAVAASALLGLVVGAPCCRASEALLLRDSFAGPDGVITNEYATRNPRHRGVRHSSAWLVTSGSLLRRSGRGWTGIPDAGPADMLSRRATGSAVFRLLTRRAYAGGVTVSFSLVNRRLASTPRHPPRAWDGVHVILRWRSQRETYYVSVNRRDGTAVVKKKRPTPAAPSGAYTDLSRPVRLPVPYGGRQLIRIRVGDLPGGAVLLELAVNGRTVLTALDQGAGGPSIRGAGRVGLRGDNADFLVDDFVVSRPG